MTGTVSSFVDVVLNFGTQELMLDNIIHQAIEQTKRVVFYGDDTWIKLFPHHFLRHDGTTSFYVNDYTEVSILVWFCFLDLLSTIAQSWFLPIQVTKGAALKTIKLYLKNF